MEIIIILLILGLLVEIIESTIEYFKDLKIKESLYNTSSCTCMYIGNTYNENGYTKGIVYYISISNIKDSDCIYVCNKEFKHKPKKYRNILEFLNEWKILQEGWK